MKKGHLLLVIIILLIAIISCILIYLKKEDTQPPIVETNVGGPIQKVTDRNNYYMVENCVKKFYTYYESIYENKNHEEEDIIKTYNLLDEKYIEFKNITKENLPTILPSINESVVNVYDMYVSKQHDDIYVYIVNGILREERSKELSNFKIMVQIDNKNETFSILLQDYIDNKFSDLKTGNKLAIDKINYIDKNRNNAYVLEEISDETHILALIDRYKEEAVNNPELVYEYLDKEYRSVKFQTIGKFKEYVENNLSRITNIKLEKYKVSDYNIYKQYKCIDTDGYYYIFTESELMKYTLVLDTYTIDLPDFLEKYNKASLVQRAGYNITRCLDAINYKDYAYVYNKLDFEFRAVNYTTLENFEKEIKDKLFNRNKVKSVYSYNEGSVYIYKLTIMDVNDNTKEQDMTVIMKLKEGTDFVMSFSFE